MSKTVDDITDRGLIEICDSMRKYMIDRCSVDPKSFTGKTIYSTSAHTIPRWTIAQGVSLFAHCLGLRGGSSGDLDLYGLVTGYILDPALRGRMNALVLQRDGEVRAELAQ